MHTTQQHGQKCDIWQHIWHSNLWPKITFFLWQILHHNILTWDNLQKRGFEGPGYCCLCGQPPETIQQLLIRCAFSTHLWNEAAKNFQRTNLDQDSITKTLENWTQYPYHNNILNRIWQLTPSFLLWHTWKERNNKIFRETSKSAEQVWERLKDIIQEIINIQHCEDNDFQLNLQEQRIHTTWNLIIKPTVQPKMMNQTTQSLERWSLPPSSFIKLNFDDASKGNRGPTRRGGIFRNSKGEILHIYTINLGHSANNTTELNAMVKGLNIALHKGYHKLILEGDSSLVITICNKLLNGTLPCKVSQSWHLLAIIEALPTTLRNIEVFLPLHIRRKANKVVDHLANVGVESSINTLSDSWDKIRDTTRGSMCHPGN